MPTPKGRSSRRELLTLGAATTAGVGISTLTPPQAVAADGDPVRLATTNQAYNPTIIEIVDSGQPGLKVISHSDDGSLIGENSSSDGYGVSARGSHIGLNAVGDDVGVYTVSDYGVGLRALTYDGVAVEANTAVDAGYALKVQGATHFSRSGRGVIPAGARTLVIPASIRPGTLALATLQNREAGISIEAAVPEQASQTLTIWLTRAPRSNLSVGWLLLD